MSALRKLFRVWIRRFADLFRKQKRDAELAAELESHLQLHIEDNLRAGMTPEAARRDALLKLGGVEQTKENYRDRRGLPFLEILVQDLRFTSRTLRKSPGFAAVAVLTLALGIGANSAIFTVVYGVLFRPLPFPEPDGIMELVEGGQEQSGEMDVTATQLQRLREFGQVFEHIAGWTDQGFNVAAGHGSEHVRGTPVSADYFQVLGVHPAAGREFLAEEDQGPGQRVAILSHALWKRRFGSELSAIGGKALLNGEAYTVIGVMPAGFDPRGYSDINPGLPVDVWVPLALVAKTAGSGENIAVLARLKRGLTQPQIDAQMNLVTEQFRKEFPGDVGPKTRMSFLPYQFMLGADLRPFLLLLLGAIGFVLLIACANVASLLLAKGGSRAREIALRAALGATRARLSRQLLTESIVMGLAGGALGLAFAGASLGSLLAIAPFDLPRMSDIHLDGWAFGFTLLISVLTGSLSGLAPAIFSTRTGLNDVLKAGESRATSGAGRTKLRQGLVVGEFALSLVLLTGAGLMIATFAKLMSVNPGFDPHNVVSMQFWLNGSKYHSTPEITTFYRDVERRIGSLPGVEAVGIVAAGLPLERGGHSAVKIAGEQQPEWKPCDYREASPDYFRAMGIVLHRGRGILETDTATSNQVVVVNDAFVQQYLAGRGPVGEHVFIGDVSREIVGVAADVRSFLDRPTPPTAFIPAGQASFEGSRAWEEWFPRSVVLRSSVAPLGLGKTMRKAIEGVDPLVPTGAIRSMEEMMSRSLALRNFMMRLLGVFGGLALLLASVGLYGVISFLVTRRTREIGVRIALGARSSEVLRLILAEGMKLVVIGVVIGIGAALVLTRVLESMVYGVSLRDPLIFVLVSLVMIAVSLLACYVPAWRASRVDPITALRHE
ncbi:MAG TPA: ABC transporter permease [Candidatus Acidoferrum sp.]|nr:ABC transporter permease [Candidatus Acidoferrum sp.]